MRKGIRAVRNAARDGKRIYACLSDFHRRNTIIKALFPAEHTYEDEKGEDGNTRKEYALRLRKA